MPKRQFTENELAEAIGAWLQIHGWEVYNEVQPSRYGRVADMVATRGEKIWIIEAKGNLTLQLIEQAEKWLGFAERSIIAYPRVAKGAGGTMRARYLAKRLCDWLGISMLEVSQDTWEEEPRIRFELEIEKHEPIGRMKEAMRACLHPAQKLTRPGTANHDHVTPFSITKEKATAFIEEHPGCTLKELTEGIDHHYSSNISARKNLCKWIGAGMLGNIRMEGIPIRLTKCPEQEEEKT